MNRSEDTQKETRIKAKCIFYHLDRIERIGKYEHLFDEAAASPDEERLRLLNDCFTSGECLEDYEADERGELPPDLKRGVLSQDARFDLLEKAGGRMSECRNRYAGDPIPDVNVNENA